VWANDQFERMTLYPKEDIIGRNCRFLQGGTSLPVPHSSAARFPVVQSE
jgi:hypothetical protein